MVYPKDKEFLYGENFDFVAGLYRQYLEDSSTVPVQWKSYFESVGDSLGDVFSEASGPSWKKKQHHKKPAEKNVANLDEQAIKDSLGALMLIRLYRVRGHLGARLDPLGLIEKKEISELHPKMFGFGEKDWGRPIFLNGVLGFERASLVDILSKLQATYCGSFGAEFMHIIDPDQKQWIQERLENPSTLKDFSKEDREGLLKHLIHAESFEEFLNTKHKGAKRFGLEGCESIIPCLLEAIKVSSKSGVKDVVLGMAHRGRLNVLANVMEKPLEKIFYEFTKAYQYCSSVEGSGDVKYHLGYSNTLKTAHGDVDLSLTPNPSHLEAVGPVVLGRVRAKQDLASDQNHVTAMSLLLHGDAAFPGQGVVSECFGLSDLQGYKTGGTFHLVINNQIGFTTSPHDSKSSAYCSDFAKAIGAPIFHVNGDDPEAVLFVTRLAAEFRHTFQKDVVVDLIGYRRFGHNETDDPSFTQPVMYEKITHHPSVRVTYEKHLLDKGLIEGRFIETIKDARKTVLEKAYEKAQSHGPLMPDWMTGRWADYRVGPLGSVDSDVSIETLKGLLKQLMVRPQGFDLHKRMTRLLEAKQVMFETCEGIDWGTAEALAFATILNEGHPIRLSGQDSGRGTFSQRHAIWTDQTTEKTHIPLNHLGRNQAFIEILNSPLSEFSVLGYEYGYTLSAPKSLVLWEAQFGDFSNGAQVVIDQFISSGESKWHRLSGLVMLLPHGYEGQGPEHSSARLERYLQLCAENNIHVAYCSTPANYYHILRRQVLGEFRKPLVLMTPKSLLRHPLATSTFKDLSVGSSFQPVIGESHKIDSPRRLVLCSGKVYYDLLQARIENKMDHVAIVRIEELYPFPEALLMKELKQYKTSDVIWCQEEPENMGAWHFVDRRLEDAMAKVGMNQKRPVYVGRKASASPATGFATVHEREQAAFVQVALGLKEKES